MRDGMRRNAHADLNLLECLLIAQNNPRYDFRLGAIEAVAHWLHVPEVFANQVHELLVLQMAGGADDQIAWSEALLVEIEYRLAFKFLNCILRSKDRLAERVIFPEILRENFVDEIIGVVLVHLDFFENHTAFAADVLNVKDRIQHQVAEPVLIQIPIETERMCCISSVMRVSPLGKTSRRILRVSSTMASSQPASRRSARKRKPLQLLLHTGADVREYILALQNQ